MPQTIDPTAAAPVAAFEPAMPIAIAAASAPRTSPRLSPQSAALDAFDRERLTPPRRPSPLGPGLPALGSPDLSPSTPTSLFESSPSTPPIRPHGVFGRRLSRRASDAPEDLALSLVQSDALKVALRDLFVQGRQDRRPISGPAVALSRSRTTLELDPQDDSGERWIATRFGEAYYVAVMHPDTEPSGVWYYVGNWPYSVQSSPLEP